MAIILKRTPEGAAWLRHPKWQWKASTIRSTVYLTWSSADGWVDHFGNRHVEIGREVWHHGATIVLADQAQLAEWVSQLSQPVRSGNPRLPARMLEALEVDAALHARWREILRAAA